MTDLFSQTKVSPVLLAVLLMVSFPSFAYMGPGAGVTAFGCLLALAAGIWYIFKGFLWLPLKRLLNKTPAPVSEAVEHAPTPDETNQQGKAS